MGKAYSSLRDFKSSGFQYQRPGHWQQYGRWWIAAALCSVIILVLMLRQSDDATAAIADESGDNNPLPLAIARETPPASTTGQISIPLNLPAPANRQGRLMPANYTPTPVHIPRNSLPAENGNRPAAARDRPPSPKNDREAWRSTRVKAGESLSLIFSRLGFSARELQDILALGKPVARLKKIFPKDELRYQADGQGRLQALSYRYDDEHSLLIQRQQDGYTARTINHPIEHRRKYATAVIEDSLFLAAQKAGLSDRLTMELAGIFGWDIDFVLDIRKGDEFTLIYDELYQEGEKLRDGAILAAEFTNRNKTYRAIRFSDGHYYSEKGNSLRKAFLRTPVNFTRISSRFSLGRKHPILHHIRAHHGVDYAAPSRTPIKATGDGRITYKGRKGGYGRVIVIQHGSRYSTLYAHMSGYRRGMHTGKRVKQGETIGYVGQSGLATGPHLHYEFRVNGVHRNPLTVKLPDARPLKKSQMASFKAMARPLLAQLDILKQSPTQLAER